MNKMKCKQCLLHNGIQGVHIEEDGLCNFCRLSIGHGTGEEEKKRYENKFAHLVEQYGKKGTYDCILAYSGGKDSTYTLYVLQEKYGLTPLVLTFDNWFQSEKAHDNIRKVVRRTNVDHLTIRPAFDTFARMVKGCLEKGFYPERTMQRASAVCTTCLALIRFITFRYAIEKHIPFVVFGLSPGQAPVSTSVFKTNSAMLKTMQEFVMQPLETKLGIDCRNYFLEARHLESQALFPYSINPLAFLPYDESRIYRTIQSLDWEKPDDTDPNSTNCLLNGFANQIHETQYGFNPYIFEISHLVRQGKISRQEGRERLLHPADENVVAGIRKILNTAM